MRAERHMIFRLKAGFLFLVFTLVFTFAGHTQENADEYRKTIEMADSYFTKGDYINAKASYQIAVRIAPEEQYPKDRLKQSLDMIKAQMYQNSLYTQKIQVADELYNKKDLDAALKVYQEALTILPTDAYANGRIQEIAKIQEQARQLELNYQASISNADQFLTEGKLNQALKEYRNAAALKPAEAYPGEQAASDRFGSAPSIHRDRLGFLCFHN